MKNFVFLAGVLAVVMATAVVGVVLKGRSGNLESEFPAALGPSKPKSTLKPFASESELKELLAKIQIKARTPSSANTSVVAKDGVAATDMDAKEASPTPQGESVTNTQTVGVDEGGIVKVHKDHLVILRRGRLFTVKIGDGALTPVSSADAFGPDIDPSGTWYDEMLISDRTVAVIGYSYQRGGTEIGIFRIGDDGRLTFKSTWHLRSNDYYSARNYASRLVGGKLVFYTPQFLGYSGRDPIDDFPAVRKWRKGASTDEFKPTTTPAQVYRVPGAENFGWGTTIHSVTTCDLESDDFGCTSTSVIGPAGRVFYVSQSSVYIWVTHWNPSGSENGNNSTLYRMPLDGSAPSAVGVSGGPVDQFSFLESEDGFINVLVRSNGAGDGMWKSNIASGDTALFRYAIANFGDGTSDASRASYKSLPLVRGWNFQNRFIGKYLLYGSAGDGYRNDASDSTLYAVRWTDGATYAVNLKHGVERIEAMADDAVIVGSRGADLIFTSVSLTNGVRADSDYVRRNAAQGESRSHGFFYRPLDKESGILGLPIVEGRAGFSYYDEYVSGSASVVYLRNDSLDLKELGELHSKQSGRIDDGCRASCIDWYGNARPLFLRGRVFALLGYEIVEGSIDDGRIRETRRVNFAPGRG
ncbi:MAG TPA: beta-propeller domain-containing protein [Pyrinomonadaceae bacterium]|nr:beta-propeller domain-containing protein [Pyrinomonadaceae bacterium]